MMKKFIFFLLLLFTFSVGAFAVDIGSGNDDKASCEDVLSKADVSAVTSNLIIVNLETDILIRAEQISFAEYRVFKIPAVTFRMANVKHYRQGFSLNDVPKPDNENLPSKLISFTIRNSI